MGMDGRTKPLSSALVKNIILPTYGLDGRTKPLTSALVKKYKSSYVMGGWTNQATDECLVNI